MSRNRICAVDPVIVKENKILLIKRAFGIFKGYWVLPGGKIKPEETAESACIREAKEETGLDVEVVKFLGFYDSPERDPEKHAISLAFLCKPLKGDLKTNSEATEIKFFSFQNLPEKMGFDHRRIVEDAMRVLGYRKNILDKFISIS